MAEVFVINYDIIFEFLVQLIIIGYILGHIPMLIGLGLQGVIKLFKLA